jgi:outer membrane protein TolC
MTRNSWAAIVAAATLSLSVPTTGAAQSKSPDVITDAHVQELVHAAALRAGVSGRLDALPQSATAQSAPADSASLALTLDDAIKLALDRNLDIAVQRLNPQTFDFSIAALHSAYNPALTSTVGTQAFVQPPGSTLNGVPAGSTGVTTATGTFNGGLSQNFLWGGGNLLATLNNARQSTDNITSTINPAYNTTYSVQYTQPLLRNFKIDSTRQQLTITNLNQDISEIQLQALIINTVSNVRNAYWDYVFATQSVEVARRSVELAEQLVRDNQTRVEIGTMAPIDVVQAQSQAATQRQNLATAEGTRRTAELTLKRLIVAGTQDPNWSLPIVPMDRPEFVPTPVDVTAAVKRALENRTDLQQAKKNLKVNDVTLEYLHNQTLPQADVIARYGLAGRGGTVLQRASATGSNGINPIVSQVPGGFGDALNTMFQQEFPTWNVQLTVTYPLGTSQAEANVARARVQMQQVEAQLKQIELQIATDVTNAAVSVQNNVERVQAAQAAREFAQKQLEAEQSKFEVGMSTNYFVVQAQRDLATAQNNELSAVLAYRRSLVELERLQQTTLGSTNITILGR